MTLALIAAYDRNRVIGNKGHIPWRIPGEQTRFRELTTGNIVIMGRRSYEEIGHPLPNRTTIVLSSTKNFHGENCMTAASLEEAIQLAASLPDEASLPAKVPECQYAASINRNTGTTGSRNIYIAGGARVYQEALPLVDKMYITEVDCKTDGDTYFPDFDEALFSKKIAEHFDGEIPYTYVTYIRKNYEL